MTPEQYSMIVGKLSMLETFIAALCKASPDQGALQSELAKQREVLASVLLNSQHQDPHVHSVLERIDALAKAIWGRAL